MLKNSQLAAILQRQRLSDTVYEVLAAAGEICKNLPIAKANGFIGFCHTALSFVHGLASGRPYKKAFLFKTMPG